MEKLTTGKVLATNSCNNFSELANLASSSSSRVTPIGAEFLPSISSDEVSEIQGIEDPVQAQLLGRNMVGHKIAYKIQQAFFQARIQGLGKLFQESTVRSSRIRLVYSTLAEIKERRSPLEHVADEVGKEKKQPDASETFLKQLVRVAVADYHVYMELNANNALHVEKH